MGFARDAYTTMAVLWRKAMRVPSTDVAMGEVESVSIGQRLDSGQRLSLIEVLSSGARRLCLGSETELKNIAVGDRVLVRFRSNEYICRTDTCRGSEMRTKQRTYWHMIEACYKLERVYELADLG